MECISLFTALSQLMGSRGSPSSLFIVNILYVCIYIYIYEVGVCMKSQKLVVDYFEELGVVKGKGPKGDGRSRSSLA